MKRYLSIMLVLVLILIMGGCGNKGAGKSDVTENQSVNSVQKNQIESAAADKEIEQEQIKVKETEESKENTKEQTNNRLNEESTISNEVKQASPTDPAFSPEIIKRASLLVTQNFGNHIIFNKKVPIDDKSYVLDILKANLDVETKYDGGFISSINGLKTQGSVMNGERGDWFYYVNGVCSHVGAMDYKLMTGETVWWDYHPWSTGPAVSSVIGCYPEPFVHGYNGKTGSINILYSEGNLNNANSLCDSLKARGVSSVKVSGLSEELVKNRHGPTIVLGKWSMLKEIYYLDNLNKAYRKNGTSVHFLDNGLELLNYKGEVSKNIDGSAAVIVATGEGLGDANPLWLAAGTDNSAVTQAIDILVKNPSKIFQLYNAAVSSGEIIALPLQ
ncbi:MAG: DUF4430 domain-containing protein [Bacillota bacterium]|nr:DUF4430 domain-containing protein [Bacillota bacterium]